MSSLLKWLKRYTLLILIVVPFLLFSVYYSFRIFAPVNFKNNETVFKEIFGFGLTILGSGIFLAILKWLQFTGLFEEELNKIIDGSDFDKKLGNAVSGALYSDKYIKNFREKELVDLWGRVNKALFKNQFSDDIAARIENKMKDIFIHNSNLSHYYKDSVYRIDATLRNDNYLEINLRIDTSIIPQNAGLIKYDFDYYVCKKNAADTIASLEFHTIKIDGEDVFPGNVHTVINNEKQIKKKFEKDLEGGNKYSLYLHLTMIHDIDVDHQLVVISERFIDHWRVELEHRGAFIPYFVPVGKESFQNLPETGNKQIWKFDGMVFPENGFRIIFAKK